LAEAVGRSLNRSEFEFDSAAIDPGPLPSEAVNFLRSRGVAIPNRPAKRLHDLPGFDQYQLVISLFPGAKRVLPPPARKMVQLEWPVPDPCTISGSSEQIQAAYESAYALIAQQLSILIENLAGEERTDSVQNQK
jgi:protein-tyrosine-phosphatase